MDRCLAYVVARIVLGALIRGLSEAPQIAVSIPCGQGAAALYRPVDQRLSDHVLAGVERQGDSSKKFLKCELVHISERLPPVQSICSTRRFERLLEAGGFWLSETQTYTWRDTMSARKSMLAIAAAVAMWATIQPATVLAQNSGLGGDGATRLMWRGTDYSISLWKLDANLNLVTSHVYGPYPGYIPIAITTDSFSYTYVLWRYTDGSISLWLVDPNLNFVNSHIYGPYTGYIAKGLSVDTSGSKSNFRVIWRYTNGSVSVWNVDGNLNFVASHVYGPYFGWDPGYTTE
jgi:hypothetical protein